MENKKLWGIVLIVAVISLAVGYGVGSLGNSAITQKYNTLAEKVAKLFPPTNPVKTVSGPITAISGDKITISTPASMNPLEDLPTSRVIMISDSTKIVSVAVKDPIIYAKELAAYNKLLAGKVPSPGTNPPPSVTIEKTLTVKDLKVGNNVSVDAAQDIKTLSSFEATKIVVPAVPALVVPAPSVRIP